MLRKINFSKSTITDDRIMSKENFSIIFFAGFEELEQLIRYMSGKIY